MEWDGAGKEIGIEIWRVQNERSDADVPHFGIKRVLKETYGYFFRGDSYILLSTRKGLGNEFLYDVHFWIGRESTADEYGVAAYKTVEVRPCLISNLLVIFYSLHYLSYLFFACKTVAICPCLRFDPLVECHLPTEFYVQECVQKGSRYCCCVQYRRVMLELFAIETACLLILTA